MERKKGLFFTLVGLGFIPVISVANINNDIKILKKLSEPPKLIKSESSKVYNKQVITSKLNFSPEAGTQFEVKGSLTLSELLKLISNAFNVNVVYDKDVSLNLNNSYYFYINANSLEEIAKMLQKQLNVWVSYNPLTKTLSLKKYKWITIESYDMEGKTTFQLTAGAGGGSGSSNQSGSANNQQSSSSGSSSSGSSSGSSSSGGGGGGGVGFTYTTQNMDVRTFLSILQNLNIEVYPFLGFFKAKVSPAQYKAIKSIFSTLKKYQEVIIGKVAIYKIDLNKGFQHGIDWNAIFKGFKVGSIKRINANISLNPFSSNQINLNVAFLNNANQQYALISMLKQLGDVKAVNEWIFEGKTGTIIPLANYKEEPYITYSIVEGQQTTQVVPQIDYKYVGFIGNLYVSKKLKEHKYFVEIALNISDIYGYFVVQTQDFSEQIPKVQASTLKVSTYIPHLGGTLVLSGFKLKSLSMTENKIPFLGDIPLLGNLFKSREVKRVDSEYIVLITLQKVGKGMKNVDDISQKVNNAINPPKKPFEILE